MQIRFTLDNQIQIDILTNKIEEDRDMKLYKEKNKIPHLNLNKGTHLMIKYLKKTFNKALTEHIHISK